MSNVVPPHPLDVVAWVTVRLHRDGSLSTQGTIGDKAMAMHMLDQAKDAIRSQIKDQPKILVPNRDVAVMPSLPTRDLGDMPEAERGDP